MRSFIRSRSFRMSPSNKKTPRGLIITMSELSHDIQKEVRGYMVVFAALLGLTIVTVAVSYLQLNVIQAVILALIIATVKGSLVACYFMHLLHEKQLIYFFLIMTVAFFIGLMFLPLLGHSDPIMGTERVGQSAVEAPAAQHH